MNKQDEKIIIFVGNSAAGKTKLSEKLAKQHSLKRIDVFDFVRPHLKRQDSLKDYELRAVYKKFSLKLRNEFYHLIEIASDWPGRTITEIVGIIRKNWKISSFNITLVFCSCPLAICLKRNSRRPKLVPLSRLKKQNAYGHNFYKILCNKLNINFIAINTGEDFINSYKDLLRKLSLRAQKIRQ